MLENVQRNCIIHSLLLRMSSGAATLKKKSLAVTFNMKNKVMTRLGHGSQRRLLKSLCRSVYMKVNSSFFSP